MRVASGVGRTGFLALTLGVGAVIVAAPTWAAPDDTPEPTTENAAAATRVHPGPRARPAQSPTSRPRARALAADGPQRAAATVVPRRSPAAGHAAATAAAAPNAAATAAVEANPVAAFLFNQTPTLTPTRTGQDSLSVVRGDLNIDDPDSAEVAYTISAAPARGAVTVDADGRYTYTPDAAYARGGTTDEFTVSVSDASSGVHIHGLEGLLNLLTFGLLGAAGHVSTVRVTVVVDPRNTAPEASAMAGDPDPGTGTVTGRVTGSDADGDPLTYTGSVTTAKGVATVAADGTFAYVPTDAARHDAASAVATAVDRTDSFIVTVADNYGGTANVTVVVAVSPQNAAPVGGVEVGAPNPGTGQVSGRVSATDPDGDILTYTGSAATAKGAVTVAPDGTFVYVPTAAARHNAAATNAGVAVKTDTFTVTVSDGSGGATGIGVTVAIAPANTVPVSGGAVVGTPNAGSGLVIGSITAADADGDTFSYAASTPGKGSVSVAADGSFGYTPTDAARQAAAASGATDADKTDAFTVTISDGHGGSVAVPVSVAVAAAVAVVPSQVNFAFAYGAGAQYWTAEARGALDATAAALASYFVVSAPVTITVSVSGINSPSSGTLAYAWVDFTGTSAGFYPTLVQSEILSNGVDANGGTADASITYNWYYPWALGSSVNGSQYDFKAVALHELLHTLGFLTGTGSPTALDRNWTTYDSFVANSAGVRVISGDYTVGAAYLADFTGGNGGLYFAGPNAVAAYGGPVPLYTPSTWANSSSVSHVNQLSGYVMNPSSNRGLGVRVLTPVEIAMLRDLGYTVRDTPLVYAFVLLGLVRRRRK